jgi:hypothetical protein
VSVSQELTEHESHEEASTMTARTNERAHTNRRDQAATRPREATEAAPTRHGRAARFPLPAAALVAIALAAVAAAPVRGVAVNVTVTDAAGEPVASAVVDLGLGGPTRATDDGGVATFEVDESKIGEEVSLVVAFTDPTSGERHTVPLTVTLQRDLPVTLPRTGAPPRAGGPRAGEPSAGCRFAGGRFELALGAGTGEVDETPLVRQGFDIRTAFATGTEISRSSGSKSGAELAEINRMEDKEHEVEGRGELEARVPLRWRGCYDDGFVPSLRLVAGKADATFTSRNLENSALDQSFSGDGWRYGAGIDLTLLRPGRRALVFVGLDYDRTESIDVERSVDLATTFFPPGSVTLRDEVSYEQESIAGRLGVGYAGERFVPYFGLRYTQFEATLELDSDIDITVLFPTLPPGSQVVREQRVENRFEDDYFELQAGLWARLAGALSGRVEATVGEHSSEVVVGLGLAF